MQLPEANFIKYAYDSIFDDFNMNLSERLREGDRPKFLCSLFSPEPHRKAVVALYSFNLEIARVRDDVSEPLVGQVRLKWWYEATKKLGTGKVPNHPVVLAVDQVFSKYELDPAVLLSLVDAYADDLWASRPDHLTALFDLLDRTLGDLNNLVIHVLGGGGSKDAIKAGYHVARAWGLSQQLRNLPKIVSRGKIYIPEEICQRESVSLLDIMELNRPVPLRDSVTQLLRTIAEIAEKELLQARALREAIDPCVRPALLSAVLAEQDLLALKANDFDPRRLRHRSLEPGPISMVKLWWSARRGIY